MRTVSVLLLSIHYNLQKHLKLFAIYIFCIWLLHIYVSKTAIMDLMTCQ